MRGKKRQPAGSPYLPLNVPRDSGTNTCHFFSFYWLYLEGKEVWYTRFRLTCDQCADISFVYIFNLSRHRWKSSVKAAPRGYFLCTFCLYSLFVGHVELFLHLKASCAEGLLFPMSGCAGVKRQFTQKSKTHTFSAIRLLRLIGCWVLVVSRDVCLLVPKNKYLNVVFPYRNRDCYWR